MKFFISLCFIAMSALLVSGQSKEIKKYADSSEVPRITIEDAKKSFDDGTAVFVDSRSVEAYKLERIKGALFIEGAAENRFDSLPKGKKIIVYCT